MIFKVDNFILEINNSQGKLYRDDQLLFKGDGYLSIKQLLVLTNNNEKVRNKFRAQLEMREACKFKTQEQNLADKKKYEQQEYDRTTTDSRYKRTKRRR